MLIPIDIHILLGQRLSLLSFQESTIFPPKGRKLGFVQSVSAADGHSSDSRLDPDSYPFFHLFLRIFGNAIALLTLCNY